MATLLRDTPDGFETAVEYMNTLGKEVLTEICDEVMQYLQFNAASLNTAEWQKKLQQFDKESTVHKAHSLSNAILYLYRSAAKNRLTSEAFQEQLSASMVFNESSLSILSSIWSSQGSNLLVSGSASHMLGVGQLVDVQWKVGVAMSSDSCRSLNSPYVTLTMTVAMPSGQLKTFPLELTMVQFRNFTNQLKEIGAMMETV